jgi:dienelactone hydrolase
MSKRRVLFAGVIAAIALGACGQAFSPAVFDVAGARRPDTAPTFGPRRDAGHGISLEEVTFASTEWSAGGSARPIRLRAVLARPAAPGRRPAVLVAHGLGAAAEPATAVEVARNLDVVVLAISAPGLGGSEGVPVTFDDPRPLFATVPDVRGSWLYAYVHGLLRGVTFVQGLPDVDGRAVVLTGTSMGGVASLIANGVDDRIGGVLAMNASGGLEAAARRGSWLRKLVESAGGLKLDDRAARAFFRALDPLAFAGTQHGAAWLMAGAQDEFFPIDQVIRTHAALEAPSKSLALIADYDHGWYFGNGCPARCMPGAPRPADGCPAGCPRTCSGEWPYCGPQASYNRQDEVVARWSLLLRALVARVAHPRRPFQPPSQEPVVERRAEEIVVWVGMVRPAAVRLAFSDNGGFTYGQLRLHAQPDGSYTARRPLSRAAILIAEVEGPDGAVVTSIPELPSRFKPAIRPFMPVQR